MNRRTFLHTSVALAGASLFAAETKRKIKIGFLGVAHSHAAGKLKAVQASTDWELVGIAEDDAAVRQKFAATGARFMDAAELLRECEVVAVESNVRDHYRQAKAVLAAGKHLHIEKPPATTLAEFRELLDLARRGKRVMQMGYMWRYHPGFRKIFEAVRSGWLGEVSLVRATMDSFYPTGPMRDLLGEFRGGAMFELGCHMIDQLVRLMGAPRNVSTALRTHGQPDRLADNTVAVFEFPKALCILHVNLLHPGAGAHRAFEVVGSNGTAVMRPIEPPTLVLDLAKSAGPYKKGSQTVTLPTYERYVPEFADLADVVRAGRALEVTAEEDLRVQEWVLKACEM